VERVRSWQEKSSAKLEGRQIAAALARCIYSMIPKKPAMDLIRGGYRFPA